MSATLANLIGYGLASARPAAGVPGRLYYSSDTDALERDNGTTWDAWTPGGGGGGGGGGLTVIAEVVVGSGGASTIAFPTIPNTYKKIAVDITGRGTASAVAVTLLMQCNGDTSNDYDDQRGVFYDGNNSLGDEGNAATSARVGFLTAATAPADSPGTAHIEIPGYARTAWHKAILSQTGGRFDTAAAQSIVIAANFRSAAAIASLLFSLSSGDFAEHTVATLYGIG